MRVTPEEQATLRPGLDVARLERFLDRVAQVPEVRAAILAAISVDVGAGFRMGTQPGGRMLPMQPEDLTFGDPALEREWRALTRRAG